MTRSILQIIFIINLLLISEASAQESLSGVKAGINLATITGDNDADKNLKAGLSLGVFTRLPIAKSFVIQPELLYNSKGVKYNYDDNIFADGESKVKLHYIDLPVKLVYQITDDFDVQFGPYLSYLVQANVDTDAEILGFFNIDDEDDLDRNNFNAFDYGLVGGLSFNFEPLLIGINYTLGLNPVAKDDKPAEAFIGNGKNSVLQIYLGFVL
jgi:hypothetical protein